MTATATEALGLRLTISLVCFQSDRALLERTLCSLQWALAHARQHLSLAANLTLIDNGQQANDMKQLLNACGWESNSSVIANPENIGFGRANNQGIVNARSDYHLVLNPDVELADSALLSGLLHLQQHPNVAAISPRCRNRKGEVEHLCKRYPSVFDLLLRGFAPRWIKLQFATRLAHYEYQTLADSTQTSAVQLISGCFMLCRMNKLQQVIGFDERYFLYFEDFDLSLRLTSKGELHHVPACIITHHGGGAARKGWRHILLFIVSACRFFNRHGWRWW